MTLDPTPPGIHPTDAMLLLLGDVRSDADAAALVAELRLDEVPVSLTGEDPFAPALVAAAWTHLGHCGACSTRRGALLGELAPALSSIASDSPPDLASTLDTRVRAAVVALVPAATAVPESLIRSVPPRRRWFAGRGAAGIGATSGRGGTVARPWIVGIAAAALLLAVGAAFALRPRTTEQSAVGTVPPRVGQSTPSDTASREKSPSPETEAAAAETEAALAAGAMADEPTPSTPATQGAPPATAAISSVDQAAPIPAAPEAAAGRATSLPVEPSPARASSKTTAESAEVGGAEAANPVPPQPAKKKASVPPTAAAAAAGPPAGSEPFGAEADLGVFADTAAALDSFAERVVAPTEATATQLGQQQPGAASGNAANTASPAAAPLSAPAPSPSPEAALCPTVKGSPRVRARIGDRAVLVLRTADGTVTADVVLDAVSCAELARRSLTPATVPVSG